MATSGKKGTALRLPEVDDHREAKVSRTEVGGATGEGAVRRTYLRSRQLSWALVTSKPPA
jgi:hypothetical protein